MKVVLTSWAPFVAGAEIAVQRLAVGLASAGHDVLLVVGTRGEAMQVFQDAGIRTEFVPQKFTDKIHWFQYRAARKKLMAVLRREQPDIVHSNDLPTHQMTSDAARRLNIPRVCHHRWIFEGQAIDWLNKYDADRHLFVSHALLTYLSDRSEQLASSPREVVYDGLELPRLPAETDRQAAREELGLPIERRIALFAGQIIERKGVADLLHAWKHLQESNEEGGEAAMLVIVGDDLENDGRYRQTMEDLARELRVDVRFVGFQKRVDRWLTAADFALVPSHAEPLGNATLEAMAHGRPVIGSRVGGIPEMIDHEASGLLVEPRAPDQLAAAMQRMLRDESLRASCGEQARKMCEQRFSLAVHVSNVLEQYAAVIEGCHATV